MERTLCIIKPDAVKRKIVGKIIKRIENSDLNIVAVKMITLDEKEASGFYVVHKSLHFFDNLVAFMTSGPSILVVLEGDDVIFRFRKLIGATDYRKAVDGTIRKEFATDIEKNVVHGSDSIDSAFFEINYFFDLSEID